MSEQKIEPALSAREWGPMPIRVGTYRLGYRADLSPTNVLVGNGTISIQDSYGEASDAPLAAVIAIANHALSDDDPRKITREWVDALRRVATAFPLLGEFREISAMADALLSYLPPETA